MFERHDMRALLALAATIVIWSTTFAGLRATLDHFSPGHMLFLRWGLASAVLLAYGAITGMRLPARRDMPAIVLAGALGFTVYQVALGWGQTGLTAAAAGFLINLAPVFATLFAAALRLERLTWRVWAGVGISSLGVVLLGLGRGGFGGSTAHAALVMLAALSFAGYVIVSKSLLARYTPLEVTTYAIVAGSVPFVLFSPGAAQAFLAAAPGAKMTVVYMAVVPASLAYVTWARALASLPASVATRALYLVPVLGIVVARVWLGEALGPLAVLGGLTMVAGVAFASVSGRRLRVASAGVPALTVPPSVATGKSAA